MHTRLHGLLAVVALTTACSSAAPPVTTKPVAGYDPKTGRLKTLSVDANRNGRIETVSYMDGARIVRIELDQDENGKVDRWDFYDANRRLEKVGLSRQNDGVMDALAFYEADGVVARMEISTKRDGTFDRIEYYAKGVLTRSTDDANGDGRPDKWDTYAPVARPAAGDPEYAVVTTAFDDAGSGRPDRRFVYGEGGSIERVELDPDGDGVFVATARPIARK